MTAITDPKPTRNRARAVHVRTIVRRGLMAALLTTGLVVMPGSPAHR